MTMNPRRVLLLVLALSLAACGFHLRGSTPDNARFAFKSLYIKAPGESAFVGDLRRALTKHRMEPVASAEQAELILEVISEQPAKQILSLSGSGRVREYQLSYRVALRAYDARQVEWLPPDAILLSRVMTYDDAEILAKEQEEARLYQDMRSDAVAQTVRRLMGAKPQE